MNAKGKKSPVRQLLARLGACSMPLGLPHQACLMTDGDGFLRGMNDPLAWVTTQEVEEILAAVARTDWPSNTPSSTPSTAEQRSRIAS